MCGRSSREALSRLCRSGLAEEHPGGWRPTVRGRRGAASGIEASAFFRRWAAKEREPGRRIELLLSAGDGRAAAEEAERWVRATPSRPAEAWFALAARLRAAGVESSPWLDLIEAERENAGGRPAEALALYARVAASPAATDAQRRAARLREAETVARVEGAGVGGRRAAAWQREFREAPPVERARALRLEASGLAREGRCDAALERLDDADRLAADLGEPALLENALARASVLSREGRLRRGGGDLRGVARAGARPRRRRGSPPASCRRRRSPSATRGSSPKRPRAWRKRSPSCGTTRPSARGCRSIWRRRSTTPAAPTAARRCSTRPARSRRAPGGGTCSASRDRIGSSCGLSRAEWEAAAADIEAMLEAARADGDDLWMLVALHHRGRLALRRGGLDRAAEDNRRAREIAERLRDRLEVGELWLEEGDRRLYEGDTEGARQAWETAAARPGGSVRHGKARRSSGWRSSRGASNGGPPAAGAGADRRAARARGLRGRRNGGAVAGPARPGGAGRGSCGAGGADSARAGRRAAGGPGLRSARARRRSRRRSRRDAAGAARSARAGARRRGLRGEPRGARRDGPAAFRRAGNRSAARRARRAGAGARPGARGRRVFLPSGASRGGPRATRRGHRAARRDAPLPPARRRARPRDSRRRGGGSAS